jgi:NAD(P)H-flavin reductase
MWNGGKPKPQRKTQICKVLKKENPEKKVVILTLLVSHKLVQDLQHPGSYVFIRKPQTTQFYDAPISVMDTNLEENWIKLAIEIKGIKTKSIDGIKEGESLAIRGPFWNGIFGLKNVYDSKDGTSIVIARGIGQAPMIPVLKKLYSNGNKIVVVMDKGGYKNIFVQEYLQQYNCDVHEMNTLVNGDLSEEAKKFLNKLIDSEKVNLVHCDCADILNLKITEYLKHKVKIACCNNARMCCGEGVCGSCSARFKGRVVKRLCKIQAEPKNLFEGRRFI